MSDLAVVLMLSVLALIFGVVSFLILLFGIEFCPLCACCVPKAALGAHVRFHEQR